MLRGKDSYATWKAASIIVWNIPYGISLARMKGTLLPTTRSMSAAVLDMGTP